MLRKDSRSLTRAKTAFPEACAKFCAYDLRAFETVNGRVFKKIQKRILWNILKSFSTNPNLNEIIYVTDNGSNLISALRGEAHIRYIYHCINLVVTKSIEECSTIHSLTLTQSERNKVVQSVKKLLKTVGIGESSTNVLRLPVTDDDETRKRRNRRAKRDDITVDDVLKEFASNNDSSSSSDNDSYDEVQLVAKL
ncbi:unnamed protein product [Rotaria magnacalcarata]|uniref:Uncharacterized protein n=1 Tax=Rotaria magnacalcarata TaxID=392030 RepID=A0A820PBU3_9BILA|nr:unnamed protein product [Rotaria magnacalcarata]